MAEQEWVLKRNCSMSPRQMALFYASICTVSLLLACFFAVQGAWYVMVFSMLELSAVGAAFLVYARHATDRECIVLTGRCLVVEVIESEKSRQYRFDASQLRVDGPGTKNTPVALVSGSMRIEVGRFLTQFKRRQLALELHSALLAVR